MSEENVRLVYEVIDAFNRRDLDACLALMDDDVEAVPRGARIHGSYYGHDGIRRSWENVFEVWPDFTVQAVEVRDLADLTSDSIRLADIDTVVNAEQSQRMGYPETKAGSWRRRALRSITSLSLTSPIAST